MIKHTIEISSEPAHLSVALEQLRIEQHKDGQDRSSSIPCEDIGLLVVDQLQTTYTHAALGALMRHGAAVVICGREHLPAGLLLPLPTHTEVVWRINEQIALRKPVRKQLWKQIVQAKLRAQAANLDDTQPEKTRILHLARSVRSNDETNIEAQGARVYWRAWLGQNSPFRRNPKGKDALNAMLNYGYTVIRAAVARAIVSAGLLAAIGLHHANRSNPFCLADDLMEPFRPLVDARVRDLHRAGEKDINPGVKCALLQLLADRVALDGRRGPLMVALPRMVASLVRCYEGKQKKLLIPTAIVKK